MEFTYKAYSIMIKKLYCSNYNICLYNDYNNYERIAILRHDVDNSLIKALELAKFENSLKIKSTYFVLLSTDFYNIASIKSLKIIKNIISLGHEIGLHFDEKKYNVFKDEEWEDSISYAIQNELEIMENLIQTPIKVVSMHRPSKKLLGYDLKIGDIINTYSSEFFNGFKYISDSRREWKENVMNIIDEGKEKNYTFLHIPFGITKKKKILKLL